MREEEYIDEKRDGRDGKCRIGWGKHEEQTGNMRMVVEEWEMNGYWACPLSDHLCNSHHDPPHHPSTHCTLLVCRMCPVSGRLKDLRVAGGNVLLSQLSGQQL